MVVPGPRLPVEPLPAQCGLQFASMQLASLALVFTVGNGGTAYHGAAFTRLFSVYSYSHPPTGALNSTYIAGQAAHDIHVSPKEKITVLAKKWREERNFWIALMAFMCWAVLARFHKVAAEQASA